MAACCCCYIRVWVNIVFLFLSLSLLILWFYSLSKLKHSKGERRKKYNKYIIVYSMNRIINYLEKKNKEIFYYNQRCRHYSSNAIRMTTLVS